MITRMPRRIKTWYALIVKVILIMPTHEPYRHTGGPHGCMLESCCSYSEWMHHPNRVGYVLVCTASTWLYTDTSMRIHFHY